MVSTPNKTTFPRPDILPLYRKVRESGKAVATLTGKRLLSLVTWEIVWLAPDPTTEPRVYTTQNGERKIVFNSKYGLPLKCVCCNAPAMHGLPRCFECHDKNLKRISQKYYLPILCAIGFLLLLIVANYLDLTDFGRVPEGAWK